MYFFQATHQDLKKLARGSLSPITPQHAGDRSWVADQWILIPDTLVQTEILKGPRWALEDLL